MADKNMNQSTEGGCLETMRYISLMAVTLWVLVLLSASLSRNEWHLIVWWIITMTVFLPILGFWIYSLVRTITRRTKVDYILLCFHITDLLLFVLAMYLRLQQGRMFFPFI